MYIVKNATHMHKNRLLGLLYYIKFNTFASDYYGMRDGGLL